MIATADKPVAAIDSVDGYDLWSAVGEPVSDEMFNSFANFGSLPVDSPGLGQVRRATTQTEKLRKDLGGVGDFTSPVTYPDNGFSHKLAGLAAYIGARPAAERGDDQCRGRLRHPCRPGRRPRPQPA